MTNQRIHKNTRSQWDVYLAGFIATIIADCIAIVCIYLMTLPRVTAYMDQFLQISGGIHR